MIKEFYNGEVTVANAVCCDCGEIHFWDSETCEVYKGKFLCENCYDMKYGYCNTCGQLYKYSDMNEDIICKGCE